MRQTAVNHLIRIIVFAPIVIILFLCWQPNNRNYKILDVSLDPIVITDTTLPSGNYYTLHFTVQFCNPSYGFLAGGVEPGLDGITEMLNSLYVYDIQGQDITQQLKGWNTTTPDVFINKKGVKRQFYSHDNLDSLVNDINSNVRSARGNKIQINRLFYIEDKKLMPSSVQVDFINYSIARYISNISDGYNDTLTKRIKMY